MDAIEKQLIHEPLIETRNRKPLRPNPIAPWEPRIGNLRVFYDVTSEEPNIVKILAVGYKKGNTLFIVFLKPPPLAVDQTGTGPIPPRQGVGRPF